jgi:integrase
MGRRTGSRNRGYFYRAGRGWFAKHDGQFLALEFQNGDRMRDREVPIAELKAAYQRAIVRDSSPTVQGATVSEVCMSYLDKVADDGSPKTYKDRAATLYDLCSGFPARFRTNGEQTEESDRIHKGYGGMAVSEFKPIDLDRWLAAHKTWKGGRRARVQAVKRAFNYGVEAGLIDRSPLLGFKAPRQNARVTYLTPEQESALIAEANPAVATAIKICIRTGARPGCEFGKLTARHVRDHGERMEWCFTVSENKTGHQTRRPRVIRITDPDIIAIVRQQITRWPTGPIFRNTQGDAWTRESISRSFRDVKKRVERDGSEFDKDACMYSCRHTYAKRTLQGFWTGRQTNIETLARLMGNSPQVCRDHYLQWTDSYNEPLWDSA